MLEILLRRWSTLIALFACSFISGSSAQSAEIWVTTGNEEKLLTREADLVGQLSPVNGTPIVIVDSQFTQQRIKGFGAALSNAAAYLFYNSPQREEILEDLFGTGSGISLSYIRLVMGGSDFNAMPPYTYDDAAYEDFELNEFSIAKDLDYVVPILRDILRINPEVRIMASPWSAPAWMKESDTLNGGQLKTGDQYLIALAEFFVRFVKSYEALGIHIDTLTVQNEPAYSTSGYPTMYMPWNVQRDLLLILGPRFAEEGITTEIVIWDHNWDLTWYPRNILDDEAGQYVAGTGWHCYAGSKNGPAELVASHPDKDIYFTECSGGDWDADFASVLGWNAQNLFIGQTRLGARTVLLWNLALDENHGPRVGAIGCEDCRGVVTVYQESGRQYVRNVEYYSLGQFSKFVQPEALRINSTTYESDGIETVAFENPDGSIVTVVANTDWNDSKDFQILVDEYYYVSSLPARSVATIVKRP